MQAAQRQSQREQITDWTQVFFGNGKDVGVQAILNLEDKRNPQTRYYKAKDLPELLQETRGKADRYISLNSFKRFSRKSEHVCQIRAIGVDVDQYKLGLTHQDVMQKVYWLVSEGKMPLPNLVVKSRGVQLFYSIQDGASVKMGWLQRYLTGEFVKLLEDVGADSNANDLSRVMRVPYSINSRNNTVVEPIILEPQAYTLDELRVFFPKVKRYRKKQTKKNRSQVVPLGMYTATNNYHVVNVNRTSDIETLIKLRNGDLTSCRNEALYIYTFHASQNVASLEAMEHKARAASADVFSTDPDEPRVTPEGEFLRTVKSGYEAGKLFQEYLKNNGFKIIQASRNDGIVKPFRTGTIMDKLKITTDEQQHLKTLVNADLAKKRKYERRIAKRRAEGMRPREEYLQQKQDKLMQLKELKAEQPTITTKEIMAKLNISRSTLYRYAKQPESEA